MDTSATGLLAQATVRFDPVLVRKYDGFGPRYTSYPTADRFSDAFNAQDYVDTLHARNQLRSQQPLSVYVHLPFCNTICYYCACNKVITKDRTRSAEYVDYVCRETAMVGALLEGPRRLVQMHWGGGTPTFLSHEEMSALMRRLRETFRFEANAEVSIEVDPRKVDAATIDLLADLGFNRLSVGIQDFDPAVQSAVNRIQSESETRTVIDAARRRGFVSVNADLIYGLPLQTVAGFAATLDKVVAARPDRIALYSYAHVPHMFKPQRRIDEAQLPSADNKLAILALAIEKLGTAGYVYIGMDHFALPADELAIAQREGTLHRNFQGYSTLPDTDLIGLGVSAIGKVGNAYVQNVRTLDEYYARLDAKALPVMRGVALDADDVLRRDVIQRLMCDFRLDTAAIGAEHGVDFGRYFATELAALAPMREDGLVDMCAGAITVTASGRLLVRALAMTFDRHLREARERARYSRVI
ncbi:MAG TPA: oxygen-independent coproporphyrinogen III oxidase [Casimicrobiaceae bacterium]|jgi:oxygen-independent coproporphyrinogen-3 oxidase